MARSLNKSRILISKALAITVFSSLFLTYGIIQVEGFLHELLDMAGIVLISICALGRLYTTAFLGGAKNERLITHGPFSVVRNPLYVFSLIGFSGIALMTSHILFIVLVPLAFLGLYTLLVGREEAFLEKQFGAEYTAYKNAVPRFLPDFSRYENPDEIKVNTKLFNKGAFDAIWWFAAYPLVELAEYLQDNGWIDPLFFLP